VRLFDAFRGSHFTLLALDSVPTVAWPTAGAPLHTSTITSAAQRLRRDYGITKPTRSLIPPDGYIGQITDHSPHVIDDQTLSRLGPAVFTSGASWIDEAATPGEHPTGSSTRTERHLAVPFSKSTTRNIVVVLAPTSREEEAAAGGACAARGSSFPRYARGNQPATRLCAASPYDRGGGAGAAPEASQRA
jgi:hypothetical protein